MKHKIISWLAVVLVLGLGLVGVARMVRADDSNYGDSNYGGCVYGQTCSTVSPTDSINPSASLEASPSGGLSTPTPQGTVGRAGTSPTPSTSSANDAFGLSGILAGPTHFLQHTPVAAPVVLYILLLILAAILLVQAIIERQNLIRLRKVLEHTTTLQQEVSVFLRLLQHNTRTPVTTITLALELLAQQHVPKVEFAQELVKIFADDANKLINNLVAELQTTPEVAAQLKASGASASSILRSRLFWAPVVAAITLTGLYDVLIKNLLGLSLNQQSLIIELAVFFGTILVLVASVGFWKRVKGRHQLGVALQARLAQLESSRQKAVAGLTTELREDHDQLGPAIVALPESHEQLLARSGFEDIGRLIFKLSLVNQLQSSATLSGVGHAAVDISAELTAVQEQLVKRYPDRPIQLKMDGLATKHIYGFLGLTDYVLAAVIQNAIQFSSPPGSPVGVTARSLSDRVEIVVQNQVAQTVTSEQLVRWFEPFSHGQGDALQFDEKGAGISLYVARLITRQVGGELVLRPAAGPAIQAVITLPYKYD